ncbi:MAG: DUF4062 domain-containing protein [Anaerolineae bacterium]|nr:DUF4062 domain-containing protein [Anaerolineae bacterium]
MPNVFISSTSELREYRQAAIDTCNSLQLVPIAMEYFPAMGKNAVDGCKEELAKSDVYVGIVAHRYGYIPDGYEHSITELELDYAKELGLECLCFVVDPNYPWSEKGRDYENHDSLERLKNKIDKSFIRVEFTSVDSFTTNLNKALIRWLQNNQGGSYAFSHSAYIKRYLSQLQDEITLYLERFVLSLVALRAESAPNKVQPSNLGKSPVILPTFFEASLPIKNTEPKEKETPRHFDNFEAAFSYFDQRVLLLGEPGAGKTTTLMTFALKAVTSSLENSSNPIPLVARIADWPSKDGPSLVEWLGVQTKLDLQILSQLHRAGSLVILLDGLDELRAESQRSFLESLEEGLGENRVLITCRVSDYENFEERLFLNGCVKLLPLTNEQIKRYLVDYPSIWNILRQESEFLETVRNPLLLSTLTFALGNDKDINQELHRLQALSDLPGDLRNSILSTFVNRLHEHERRKSNKSLAKITTLYTLLGELAAKYEEEDNTFAMAVLQGWHRGKTVLETAQLLNLVIVEDEHMIRFAHSIFQKHFASSYWLETFSSSLEDVLSIGVEFNEDMLAAFTDARLSEFLIKGLESGDVDDLTRTIKFLTLIREYPAETSSGWSDLREVQTALNKLLVQVFTSKLDNADPDIRYYGVMGLWHTLGDEGSIDPLLSSLSDDDEEVRSLAAEVLGDLRIEQATPALIRATNDPSDQVRDSAKWALSVLTRKNKNLSP